jgi:L-asparaginase II
MMHPPLVVEVLRGTHVESCHAVSAAVLDANRGVVFAAGDIDAAVFPRSAVKGLQALPLIESGAADRFALTTEELALACASHSGQPVHVATATRMLAKARQTPECLECGTHWPSDEAASRALVAEHAYPSALHNNCSGKHSGFVCVACAMGSSPRGYVQPDHPAMQEVTAALSGMSGTRLDASNRAVDGCSIPTYAIPLRALALAFARFGSGQGLDPTRAAAARRLRAAVAANPMMVAGTGRFDTRVMTALGARAFVKTGAEGVHCAALPELGLGFAVKCADGAGRASQLVTATLLQRYVAVDGDAAGLLAELARPVLRNWNGLEVGSLRLAATVD